MVSVNCSENTYTEYNRASNCCYHKRLDTHTCREISGRELSVYMSIRGISDIMYFVQNRDPSK